MGITMVEKAKIFVTDAGKVIMIISVLLWFLSSYGPGNRMSRSLDRLIVMLGEMLQWKNFHDDPTKPPFPWDAEAARWSREYRKTHANEFPVDRRELLRPERVKVKKEEPRKKPVIRLK